MAIQILKDIITNQVRTSKTREKLFYYIELIYAFTEELKSIDKKELTKITNDLDNIVREYYHKINSTFSRKTELDALAVKQGYRDCYDATSKHKDPIFQVIQFGTVYGIHEVKRIYKAKHAAFDNAELYFFIDTYYPNIESWNNLAEKLDEIKIILNPTKEQREAKKLQKIKGKVNPEIKAAIDEIAEDFRQVIEKNEYIWYLKQFLGFTAEFPKGIEYDALNSKRHHYIRQNIGRFLTKARHDTFTGGTYILIPNHAEVAEKIAHETSVATITKWQSKMYDKLGGFITELNKKFEISVIGQGLNAHDIVFHFEDGSKFTINNQIVNKVSTLGNYFYTYPTTFHHAYLPDTTRIENPCEFTVKKAFNEYIK